VTLLLGLAQNWLRPSATEASAVTALPPLPVELVISPTSAKATPVTASSSSAVVPAQTVDVPSPTVVAVVELVRQPVATLTVVRPAAAFAANPRPTSSAATTPAVSAAAASRFELVPGNRQTPQPKYPELARQRGQTGTVRIDFSVSATGAVAQAEVTRSSGFPLLDAAALQTVQERWHLPESAGRRHYVEILFQLRRAGP
jgi:protein TonB